MTTLTKNCSYWFVVVNSMLLVTFSLVVIFSTFVVVYYLYLDYSANEFYYTENELKWTTMEKGCYTILTYSFISLVVNGLLLRGIFKINNSLFLPWFFGSFYVFAAFTFIFISGATSGTWNSTQIVFSVLLLVYLGCCIKILASLYDAIDKFARGHFQEEVEASKSDVNDETAT